MTTDLEEYIRKSHLECELAMAKVPYGPWKEEPHRVEFKHVGFDCLLKRVSSHLAWCGYVALPKEHPYFEKGYHDIAELEKDDVDHALEVHGGLTYSDKCTGSICHRNEDRADEVWWLGFDCSHFGDLAPATEHIIAELKLDLSYSCYPKHYWTQAEVMEETKKLAEQLRDIGVKDKV